MAELKNRNIYKYETYAPYYLCSFACHYFNLVNQRKEIYWEASNIPNLRLHIIFVAPPGSFKSFFLRTMGDNNHGIFANTNSNIGHINSTTESGFVGSIGEDGEIISGDAQIYSNGFISVDEFSAITNSMTSQYNNQFAPQLLNILDHGHVHKRLRGGTLNYNTYITLWGGVQPAHFDLSSGLGRRICFLLHIPTPDENQIVVSMQQKSKNSPMNITNMSGIWEDIKLFKEKLDIIEHIEFDSSTLDYYLSNNVNVGETSMFDRIIIGYNLLKYPIEKHMTLRIDDTLRALLDKELLWRTDIKMGVEYTQIRSIMQAHGEILEEYIELPKDVLIKQCALMNLNAKQINRTIADLKEFGLIEVTKKSIRLIQF